MNNLSKVLKGIVESLKLYISQAINEVDSQYKNITYIDLKQRVRDTQTLIELGYAKQSITLKK